MTWYQKALEAPETAYDKALRIDRELETAARVIAGNIRNGFRHLPLPAPLSADAQEACHQDEEGFERRVDRHVRPWLYGGYIRPSDLEG